MIQAGVKAVWTVEPFSRAVFMTTAAGDYLNHNYRVESRGIVVDFQQVFQEKDDID